MEPMQLDLSRPRTIAEWRVQQFVETQDEFAKRLNIAVATLRSWENGRKSPRLRTRRQVSQILGIPLSLISFPEHETKKPQPEKIDALPAVA